MRDGRISCCGEPFVRQFLRCAGYRIVQKIYKSHKINPVLFCDKKKPCTTGALQPLKSGIRVEALFKPSHSSRARLLYGFQIAVNQKSHRISYFGMDEIKIFCCIGRLAVAPNHQADDTHGDLFMKCWNLFSLLWSGLAAFPKWVIFCSLSAARQITCSSCRCKICIEVRSTSK